jgi:hypothetical protein
MQINNTIIIETVVGIVIAQVVGRENLDPTTKSSAITMGNCTQCHLDVAPALRG